MAYVNGNYQKLAGAYLFREVDHRVTSFCEQNPDKKDRLLRCGIGDVTEPLVPAVLAAMHAAVDDQGRGETFHGYGPPTGYPFLREVIARCEFQDHGIDVDAEEIFVSDGSKGDCASILDILGPENRIAITDPVYPVYVDTNVMVGHTGAAGDNGQYAGLTYLPATAENNFVPDIPSTPLDLIYLCYPNNPTGETITRSQLEAWVEYARANDAIILYDVAYKDFIRDDTLPKSIYEIPGARNCAIEFHSFSKSGGFTGVRCGFTVCPRELTAKTTDGTRLVLHDLWSRRWSTKSNGVSYVVQRGAESLYSDDGKAQAKAIIDKYLQHGALLRKGCESIGLTVYGAQHSPYVWAACPDGVSSWEMFDQMLQDHQIIVMPGSGFGSCGEGYIRISAFPSAEVVAEVVERMSKISSHSA